MECGSCGTDNAPGRRYCRECGERLGQPCAVCQFFNGLSDKHCGGCGAPLRPGPAAPLGAEPASLPAYAPALPAGQGSLRAPEGPAGPEAGGPGQEVSQSEIDGLFENILDEEPGEGDA